MRAVYMLLTEGFADWEASLAAAEINKSEAFRIRTATLDGEPVVSMGGLHVVPDLPVSEMDLRDAALLLVPGGTVWEETDQPYAVSLIRSAEASGVPVGALCGATIALARAGLLDKRNHTSNHPGYLERFVEKYDGGSTYVDAPAVRDRGIISASAMGAVEFAYEVIQLLDLYPKEVQPVWLSIHQEKRVPEGAL